MAGLSATCSRFFVALPHEMTTNICSYFSLDPAVPNLQTLKMIPLEIPPNQQEKLKEAHKVTEVWFAWMHISWINREHRSLAHENMALLGKQVIQLVEEIKGCMKSCIDRGWFLDVWKVYHFTKTYIEQRKILHWAVAPEFHTQSKAFISFLLDLNQKHALGLLREKDESGYLPLHAACHVMHPSKVQQLVLADLIQKMVRKDPPSVSMLINPRIYPYKVDVAPLFLAAFSENLEAISVLLDNGADLEQKNSEEATVLQLLQEFASKDSPALAYLISLGAQLPAPTSPACRTNLYEKTEKNPTIFQWIWTLIKGS